ncbi:MAG: hypothetical protein RLZZ360_305 [Candidatus Parcubacteria bacterium]|jgi:uncharacterized membrane protein (UPF0127 family)
MSASFKLLLLTFVCGGLVLLLIVRNAPPAVSEPMPKPIATTTTRSYFEPLVPWTLGDKVVYASLATTETERSLGLSNTSALPPDIVKVFVFSTDERWSFWMKDMAYPIDIIWVTASGTVTHIAANISPDTYPASFSPSAPARYVIETIPGLFALAGISAGDSLDMSIFNQSN